MNQPKLYFAPLEGVAGYVYRNVHRRHFAGADKYFSPFLVPRPHLKLTPKEMLDVSPEQNRDLTLVPQILTNQAESFLWAAEEMRKLGYEEVNLNLGCPSGTVVSKQRGAGFLGCLEELDRFLDQVFSSVNVKVSVKTRTGMEQPEEFPVLLAVFNRYPVSELIVHPRLRVQYYRKTPMMESFRHAYAESKNPLGYNGDLFTAEDYRNLMEEFPDLSSVMLGRGILGNPGLLREIRTGQAMTAQELKNFLDDLYESYRHVLFGEQPVLYKMKELWFYMGHLFTDSDKYMKKIKKAKNGAEYQAVVEQLFREQQLIPGAGFPGTP